MPTNAEVIARTLAAEGVRYAFGVPGGEVVVLIDAIRRAGISFLLVGHEASAAFMADVTGQITGQVGVCVATLGPGAMNLATGVANAYLDRSPLLALTAQIAPDRFASFPHQRLPLDRVFGAITKGSFLVDGRSEEGVVTDAVRLAQTGRPGPVHLAIPGEIAAAQMLPLERTEIPAEIRISGGAHRAEVRAALEAAMQPLMLIGLGARPQDASVVRAALDATGWPWMTTPKGKGIVPEDHPGFLGVAGGMAIDSVIVETLALSDLIVGIGFDPVECDKPWFLDRPIVNITRWSATSGPCSSSSLINSLRDRGPKRCWTRGGGPSSPPPRPPLAGSPPLPRSGRSETSYPRRRFSPATSALTSSSRGSFGRQRAHTRFSCPTGSRRWVLGSPRPWPPICNIRCGRWWRSWGTAECS